MQESQPLPYYKRGARHATAEEHAAIIEALSQGRPELAQQAMATHIVQAAQRAGVHFPTDRKSTRLNSSHLVISYAVFCLKKKKKNYQTAYVVQCTCPK